MRTAALRTALAAFSIFCCHNVAVADAAKNHSGTPAAISGRAKKIAARQAGGARPNVKVDPPGNQSPPAGAILDLNGQSIPGGGHNTLQTYTINFVASVNSTAITFAIREDPDYITLESVQVTDLTSPGPNLMTNGDFSGGTYTNNGNSLTPVGWTYANQYGASFGGEVIGSGECPAGGTPFCWNDGAVDAYDAISQNITTVVGHTYKISFAVADGSGQATFSRLSNSTLEGVDLTVYAQSGLPAPGGTTTGVPTLGNAGVVLMGLLLTAAGALQLRRYVQVR